MSMAQRERQALVATMQAVGAGAPTLCGTWTAHDLAAHLVVRERHLTAAPGIMFKPLAGHLDSVQSKVSQRPFAELLEQVRTGPPWWSPLKPIDAVANLTEMFVHHEDLRRAESGWEPRELSDADQAALWSTVRRMARMAYRKSPVTVVLATPSGERVTAHNVGGDAVVLTGPPAELLMHAFGRNEARIDSSGSPEQVAAVFEADRSI